MKIGDFFAFLGTLLLLTHIVPIRSWGADHLTTTRYDTQSPIWSVGSGDLDGDKKNEIVLGSIDHYIYVVDSSGRTLWKFDVQGLPLAIAISDVNGDGRKDILVASEDTQGRLYVLEYKKGGLWTYAGERPFLCVAAGDIDADGKNEVVGGALGGLLYVLDGEGKIRWKKRIVEKSSIGAVAVGDIMGDGREEIVCGTRKEGIWALNEFGNALWQINGRRGLEENYARHWVRSVVIDDINADGRNEVLIGSRPSGMVTLVSGTGKTMWKKNFPQIVNKSSNAQIGVGNITGDEKKEVICLLQGIVFEGSKGTSPIMILNHDGNTVLKNLPGNSFFSLGVVTADDGGYSKILLSSPTRGAYFCKVGIEPAKHVPSGQVFPRDRDNLDLLVEMVNRIQVPKDQTLKGLSSSKMHVLFPYKADLNRASIEKLMNFLKTLENSNLCFELMVTHMYEKKRNAEDERKQPNWTKKRGTYSQGEILKTVQLYESLKIPFYVLVGKQCTFYMHLDTMEMILKAAPLFCRGFIVNEDDYSRKRIFRRFHEKIEKIMDMLLRHGNKKLIMDEYMDYWAKVPTKPAIGKALFNKKYKDVLVPMYKSNRFVAPEQNMGMIMGLWKAGIVEEWGLCANDDLWKWESIFMNPPNDVILRMEVMGASLGATYFRIEANREFIEQKGGAWVVEEGAKRHRDLFHTLVRKGIVRSVSDRRQVVISPILLQADYDKTLWPQEDESPDTYWQNVYSRKGLLSYNFPLQVVREDYVPAYIYDMEHSYDGLFPKTPYGFVGIVPGWLNPTNIQGMNDYLRINGGFVFKKDGSRYAGDRVQGAVVGALQKHAEVLPFRASGVFMAINEFEDGYTVYLMDPGHLEVQDIDIELVMNLPVKNPKIIDAISGEILKCKEKKVDIRIPAGTFRILRVPHPSSPRSNDKGRVEVDSAR